MKSKVCTKCGIEKNIDQYSFTKPGQYYRGSCKRCVSDNTAQYLRHKFAESPRYRLWFSSKCNAKNKGLEHTIKQEDIPLPSSCKYLGIKLDYSITRYKGRRRRPNNTPSIDRIDSSKGYIPGNIQVISDLANKMKQDATIEQLVAFAKGVIKVHSKQ